MSSLDDIPEASPVELQNSVINEKAKKLRKLCCQQKVKDEEELQKEVTELVQFYPEIIDLTSDDGQTPLHLAVIYNRPEIIGILMRHKANSEIQDNSQEGCTPLMYAISKQRDLCFHVLLDYNANVNAIGRGRRSVLHVAIMHHRDVRMVKRLLQLGADIDRLDHKGKSPIHDAAKFGNHVILNEFLDANPKFVNKADDLKLTPLHYAADKGHRDCCKALLNAGANVFSINSQGETPLMIAVRNGFYQTCEVLLQGQDKQIIDIVNKTGHSTLIIATNSKKHGSCDILNLLLDYKPDVNVETKDGHTALHYAAKGGFSEKCKLLMEAGADYNKKNNSDMTPLHYAVKKGHTECVANLLGVKLFEDFESDSSLCNSYMNQDVSSISKNNEMYSDINVNVMDNSSNAPIHYALKEGSQECFRLLLKRRANVCLQDNDGNTPLHLAAMNSLTDCCCFLLSKGADVNARNKEEKTALHLAALADSRACCQILIKRNAEVSCLDKSKMSPLHYASKVGAVECCQILVKKIEKSAGKFSINTTSLHLAAAGGHLACCKELVQNKAILRCLLTKDENGLLPHELALDNNEEDTFCFLFEYAISDLRNINQGPKKRTSIADSDDPFQYPLSDLLHDCIHHKRRKAVETIVKSSKWEDALLSESSLTQNFCLLIRQYPDIAKLILDKCIERNQRSEDCQKFFTFYFFEDIYYNGDPSEDDATDGERTDQMLKVINKCTTWCLSVIEWLRGQSEYYERPCKLADCVITRLCKIGIFLFKKAIFPSDFAIQELEHLNDYEIKRGSGNKCSPFRADGRILANAREKILNRDTTENEQPLCCMVKYNRLDLLEHEVCKRLLKYKWDQYIGKIYYFLLAVTTAYVVSLSIYVTLANDWAYVRQVHNITYESVCHQLCAHERSEKTDLSLFYISDDNDAYCNSIPLIIQEGLVSHGIVRILTLISLCISVGFEWFKADHKKFTLKRMQAHIGLFSHLPAFVLIIDWTECASVTGVREEWQWQWGVISIVLAWFNLVMFLGKMPRFGFYLFILNDFMKNTLKISAFLFLQVFAFSFAFQMLLRDRLVFSSYPRSMMKIMMMTLGDLNYDDHFSNVDSPLPYPLVSHLLLVCFLGLIYVTMLNFVSSFSNDVLDKAKQQTSLITLSHQVNMLLELESMFPILRRYYTRGWLEETSSNNQECVDCFETTVSSVEPSQEQKDKELPTDQCSCGNTDLKAMLEDLTIQINDLNRQMQHGYSKSTKQRQAYH